MKFMLERFLRVPAQETTFLWGPRQTGKTTLLKQLFPNSLWIDLLKAEEFRRYVEHPEALRETLLADPSIKHVVVDEIQKVPPLLDEAHWLLENTGVRFCLCGSSARKVRRGHSNLLGGRAIRLELFGLVSAELKREFDLTRMLNHGYLPRIYQHQRPERLLNAYVADYLKEEIAAEGLVRKLPTFGQFLSAAALADAELVNFSSIARECGVSGQTVKGYFEILTDTLLGRWLPAFRKRPKRRVIGASKFYFADVGVVNHLAKRKGLEPGAELYGKALENWVFHELSAYNSYQERFADLYYWRLASGIEVDFIVNNMDVAVEAKATGKVSSHHLKGLRSVKEDHPGIKKRIVVCLEARPRKLADGILVWPVEHFCQQLWSGKIF